MSVFAWFVAFSAAALPAAGCKKETPAIVAELPVVTDDAKGLSFTYVDEKGNPHVVDTVAGCPARRRRRSA
jgi:hypothetical protein